MNAAAATPAARPDGHALASLLGDTLAALATGGDRDLLRRTVALLCQEREQGHVCVTLADWAGRSLDAGPAAAGPPFPEATKWREQLEATGLCMQAGSSEPRPLVIDGGRLYQLRHWRTEQQLLAFLREHLAATTATTAPALKHTLAELGMQPSSRPGEPDWQLAAIAAAVHRSFAVLCGGPGTGKTSTVVRLLGVLLHEEPLLRIAVCAPTGRAAARLGEALRASRSLPAAVSAAIAAIVPRTLHRLLGYLPDDSFRAGPDHPLPYDAVIVDEVSMVDPAVLAVLCTALRPTARLLLVGDKDQLAAIAAGQVLGDLCRSARPELGVGAELADFTAAATGMKLPVQPGAAPIANATIALRHNHRFGERPGIGAFAQALMQREAGQALQALAHGHQDLVHEPAAADALAAIEPVLLAQAACRDREAALASLGQGRILTASRHGPNGALAWNHRVEELLRQHGHRIDDRWYPGRPILVTANDYQNELWNGDLGVVSHGDDGKLAVWFAAGSGAVRRIAIPRLPPHETAWAMTVHKAQGSEFDEILLVMPDREGPLWQASLVYTGVTRARRRAIICADLEQLGPCLQRWPQRSSGLADALGAAAP